MKFSVTLDPVGHLALITLRESANDTDWHAGAVSLLADERFGADFRVIIDARRVRPIQPAFGHRFVTWLRDWSVRLNGTRWALLAGSGASYGAAREMALKAQGQGAHVAAFTDLRESLRWLQGNREPERNAA